MWECVVNDDHSVRIAEECGSRDKVKSTDWGSADSGTEVLADFMYVRKVTEKCMEFPKAFSRFFFFHFLHTKHHFFLFLCSERSSALVNQDIMEDVVVSADMLEKSMERSELKRLRNILLNMTKDGVRKRGW